MLPRLCLLLVVLLGASCRAHQQSWPLEATVFRNATALPPALLTTGVTEPLHPGVSLGTTYTHLESGRQEVLQRVRVGYLYHRYNQHAVQLYTEGGYRFRPGRGLDVGPWLGGGYVHSVPDTETFELTDRGEYERRRNLGRPQGLLTASLEAGYTPKRSADAGMRLFVGYQLWLQTPFVDGYVPVLPNTALHLGISVPLR